MASQANVNDLLENVFSAEGEKLESFSDWRFVASILRESMQHPNWQDGVRSCDGLPLGSLHVYGRLSEAGFDETHRLFLCARCRAPVRVCSGCDRGQRYCSRDCAVVCRRESVRRAGRRYRRTPHGRRSGAERQRRWRERARRRENVTHQGPRGTTVEAQVAAMEASSKGEDCQAASAALVCDFCGEPCGEFARRRFLGELRRGRPRLPAPRRRR